MNKEPDFWTMLYFYIESGYIISVSTTKQQSKNIQLSGAKHPVKSQLFTIDINIFLMKPCSLGQTSVLLVTP